MGNSISIFGNEGKQLKDRDGKPIVDLAAMR